jgi:hypothetical protein
VVVVTLDVLRPWWCLIRDARWTNECAPAFVSIAREGALKFCVRSPLHAGGAHGSDIQHSRN